MNNSLAVIIPVSKRESIETIQCSMDAFKNVDFCGFNEKILYCIDVPDDMSVYYLGLERSDNMEFVWVHDNELKQASAYNEGLNKYPQADYYAFFDADATPAPDFFRKCVRVDADFVSCDRHVSNVDQNSMTKTISEEYAFCNFGRKLMHKIIGKFFPASCTGLVKGEVLHNFRFTEKTSADTELYRWLLTNDYSMGYASTHYAENASPTFNHLYSQRMRWTSDAWRTCVMTVGSGKNWKENVVHALAYFLGMFPLLGGISAVPYIKHIRGYNILLHILFLQLVSIIALIKTAKGDEIKWT